MKLKKDETNYEWWFEGIDLKDRSSIILNTNEEHRMEFINSVAVYMSEKGWSEFQGFSKFDHLQQLKTQLQAVPEVENKIKMIDSFPNDKSVNNTLCQWRIDLSIEASKKNIERRIRLYKSMDQQVRYIIKCGNLQEFKNLILVEFPVKRNPEVPLNREHYEERLDLILKKKRKELERWFKKIEKEADRLLQLDILELLQKEKKSLDTHSKQNNELNPSPDNICRLEGEVWTICYEGIKKAMKHSKGLIYISYLLGSPFQQFYVMELVKAAETPEKDFLSFSSGEVSTIKTITNYRKRLLKIQAEMANEIYDPLVKKELLNEQKELKKQLLQAVGMGGRLKKNPTEISRNTNAVSEAIRRSIKSINKIHPPLWRHLYSFVNRGEYLSYTPEKDPSWITI